MPRLECVECKSCLPTQRRRRRISTALGMQEKRLAPSNLSREQGMCNAVLFLRHSLEKHSLLSSRYVSRRKTKMTACAIRMGKKPRAPRRRAICIQGRTNQSKHHDYASDSFVCMIYSAPMTLRLIACEFPILGSHGQHQLCPGRMRVYIYTCSAQRWTTFTISLHCQQDHVRPIGHRSYVVRFLLSLFDASLFLF